MSPEILFLVSLCLVIVMKIVCFILGYLTIRLGYQLIASGVKGEFKFSTNLGGFKTDLASVSPGLLFVLLGVGLIGYAMYVEKDIHVKKSPSTAEVIPESATTQPPSESPFKDFKERKNEN